MLSIVNKYVNILLLVFMLLHGSNKINNSTNIINNNYDVLFYINIPKINLNQKVYNFDSKNNNVDKGIMLISNYDLNNLKGSLILASHSGSSSISYFKHLHKLKSNDLVNIYYKDNKYTYKIINKYYIEKNGKFKYKDQDKKIYLITCDKNNKNKQIVYIGTLENKEKIRFLQKNRFFLHKKKEIGYLSEIYISVGEIINGVY